VTGNNANSGPSPLPADGEQGCAFDACRGCPRRLNGEAQYSPSPLSGAPRRRRVPSNLPDVEPFVGPKIVAWFLDIDSATVVRYAERGIIPGHPLVELGSRMHWRFLISELQVCMLAKQGSQQPTSVRSQAQGRANLK
jgi:hypothetical protein